MSPWNFCRLRMDGAVMCPASSDVLWTSGHVGLDPDRQESPPEVAEALSRPCWGNVGVHQQVPACLPASSRTL